MNEEGTTTVLGAILVVALLFTFMANVETNYRPIWDEDKEAEHFKQVLNQFADLKAETEKQTENRTLAPVSNPLHLAPPTSKGILAGPGVRGELQFQSATINTTYFAPILTILEKNGKALGKLNEAWTLAGASSSVEDIERLDSLRIRITKQTGTEDKFEFEKGMYVKLEVTDSDGNFAGWFRAYIPVKQKNDIWVEVTAASGEVLIDQEYASDVKYKEHYQFWIDTLDPSWPFEQVLNAASAPFSLELTYDWNSPDPKKQHDVEFSSAYMKRSDAGQDVFIGAGGGSTATNYNDQKSGGRLAYSIPYRHLPEVDIVLEHGALIVSQEQGNSMVLEPHVDVERSGTMTLVSMALPIYQGSTDNVGGRTSALAVTKTIRQETVLGTGPEFDLTIETQFPDIWANFLDRKLSDAGLTAPQEYNINKLADRVTISVKGSSNTPSVHDVQTRLQQTIINVDLR